MGITTNHLNALLRNPTAFQAEQRQPAGEIAGSQNLNLRNVYVGRDGQAHVSKSGFTRWIAELSGRRTGGAAFVTGMMNAGIREAVATRAMQKISDSAPLETLVGVSHQAAKEEAILRAFEGLDRRDNEFKASLNQEGVGSEMILGDSEECDEFRRGFEDQNYHLEQFTKQTLDELKNKGCDTSEILKFQKEAQTLRDKMLPLVTLRYVDITINNGINAFTTSMNAERRNDPRYDLLNYPGEPPPEIRSELNEMDEAERKKTAEIAAPVAAHAPKDVFSAACYLMGPVQDFYSKVQGSTSDSEKVIALANEILPKFSEAIAKAPDPADSLMLARMSLEIDVLLTDGMDTKGKFEYYTRNIFTDSVQSLQETGDLPTADKASEKEVEALMTVLQKKAEEGTRQLNFSDDLKAYRSLMQAP